MADQRLLLASDQRTIVLAVRHGMNWRSANDADNDIGKFLEAIGPGATITPIFEAPREWPDPTIGRVSKIPGIDAHSVTVLVDDGRVKIRSATLFNPMELSVDATRRLATGLLDALNRHNGEGSS